MSATPAPADRTWVRDLRAGTDIEEIFAVRAKEIRQRRGGGPYLSLTLGDRTGEVHALVWDNVDRIGAEAEVGRAVRVIGQVQRYNQRLQVVVRKARAVAEDEVDDGHFVRSAERHPDELWRELEDRIRSIEHGRLQQLLFRVFSDPEVEKTFRLAPAARSMHHGYRSGLIEHTLSMAQVAVDLAEHYRLDRDLVLAGILLHDLGKVWELELGHGIEYTDDGRLLGHLPLEVLFVDRKIAELDGFPAELRRHLLHVLLAHHGEYEYGSPRRPKTPEALLVHMVDTLDSRMAGMLEAMSEAAGTGEAWSPYSRILDRHVYLRRPSDDDDAGGGD